MQMRKTTPKLKAAARPRVETFSSAPAIQEASGGDGPAADAERFDAIQQAQAFDGAAALFHSGQYQPALERFRQAARGPSREMAHTAQLYARMCQRRLDAGDGPRTAEEHYNLAVALVNERRYEAAEEHLRAALAQAPDGDHLYYVLALCRGLGGDVAGAYTHMKRAIELRPQNRTAARNDPDFAEIGERPPLAELLYPERSSMS